MTKVSDKKLSMADKMYDMNSKGGKGKSPKYRMIDKNPKFDKAAEFTAQNSKGHSKAEGGMDPQQANKKGSFVAKYNQADKSGSFQAKYNM